MVNQDRIMDGIDKIYSRLNIIQEKVHRIDIKTVSIEGQFKVLNGLVKQNKEKIVEVKEDVRNIKRVAWKIAASIGSGATIVMTIIINSWRGVLAALK